MICEIGFILYILLAHFVADFIMQTDEMAKNKSSSNKWLTEHILAYGKTFVIFTLPFTLGFIFTGIGGASMVPNIVLYILLNMGLHWVTDYFTSRQTSRLWAEKRVHDFFVMIGLDQLIHAYCLIITFYLLFLG